MTDDPTPAPGPSAIEASVIVWIEDGHLRFECSKLDLEAEAAAASISGQGMPLVAGQVNRIQRGLSLAVEAGAITDMEQLTEAAEMLAGDPAETMRLSWSATEAHLLWAFAGGWPVERESVAGNPHAPRALVEWLARDPEEAVSSRARRALLEVEAPAEAAPADEPPDSGDWPAVFG